MKSLYEIFAGLEYNYYNNGQRLNFDQFDDHECISFIKKYFQTGEKGKAIFEIDLAFKNHSMRACHSVNVYLIGLSLFETFKSDINKQLEKIEVKEFSYIWFLICLYHDYTCFIERGERLPRDFDANKQLKEINSKYLCKPYNKKSIKAYMEYRENKDHGIVGGLLLNHRLKLNLEAVIKDSGTDKPHDFSHKYLHWSTNHINWYDFAGSIIIKHNIWFANKDVDTKEQKERVSIYQNSDLKLDEFIITNDKRLTFHKNPLLFLLFLIDTIEPIKIQGNGGSHTEILQNIFIETNGNQILFELRNEACNIGDVIFERAKGMEEWMKVRINKDVDNDNQIRFSISW